MVRSPMKPRPRPAGRRARRAAPEAVVIDTGNYYPQHATAGSRRSRTGTTREPLVARPARPPGGQGVQHDLRSRLLSDEAAPHGLAGPDRPAARGRRRGGEGRRVAAGRRARLRSGRHRRPRRFLAPAAGDAGLRRRPRRRRAPAAHSPRRFPRGTRTGAADPPAACCSMQRRTWHPLDEAEASSGSAARSGARGARGR